MGVYVLTRFPGRINQKAKEAEAWGKLGPSTPGTWLEAEVDTKGLPPALALDDSYF